MKKSLQDKIDSLRKRASKEQRFTCRTDLIRLKNSLSESIRNKKEAEDFRRAYESAKETALKK